MNGTVESIWSLACLAIVFAVAMTARRMGRARAGAWLVLLGLFLLAIEGPVLTLWLSFVTPRTDPDGMASLVTPMARAHVLELGGQGLAAAALLGWLALTGLRRGEPRARLILWLGLGAVAAAGLATTLFVFSRGLPVPGAAGSAGRGHFGWQPVAVGLFAWTVGLVLARPVRVDRPTAPPSTAVAATRANS